MFRNLKRRLSCLFAYYYRLFGTAYRHSFGMADAMSSLIGIFGATLVGLFGNKRWEEALALLAWQILATVFGGLFVVRLALAPYWMHKEDEAKKDADRKDQEAAEAELRRQVDEARASQARGDRREAIVTCLSDCLASADQIRQCMPTADGPSAEWNARTDAWANQALNRIREVGGPQMGIRFTTRTGVPLVFTYCHPDSQAHMQGLVALIDNLTRMIDAQSA